MVRPKALLDTDILSAVMRGNPAVTARARAYLAGHGALTFSIITRYEILRGLKAKIPLTDEIVVRAADIYAALKQGGEPIGDADVLIAATALGHGLVVVTNNEAHFRRISGLDVENWLTA